MQSHDCILSSFNLGDGVTVIQSDVPYALDEWHTAVVARNGRSASLTVNSQEVKIVHDLILLSRSITIP